MMASHQTDWLNREDEKTIFESTFYGPLSGDFSDKGLFSAAKVGYTRLVESDTSNDKSHENMERIHPSIIARGFWLDTSAYLNHQVR